MAELRLEIAGQVAAISSLFESTPHYFSSYLTDREPDFTVTVTADDLRFEQEDANAEAMEEGFRIRIFTEPFLERAAIQRKFADHLLDRGTVLLHGSTVAVDGQAYLFTARSGTGKSTHTRLWCQLFGDRAQMVNDDKPFLQITENGVLAHGSPWSGKHGLDRNICVPLKGICLLERGTENRIRSAEPSEVLELLSGYRSPDPERMEKYRALVSEAAQRVSLWHMYCSKDIQAAQIAYDAMSK